MAGELFLGRYEAVRPLGQGGMGTVWLARERGTGAEVVVKVMHERRAGDVQLRGTFLREARLLAHFRHPHVVALLDTSPDDQPPCLVMEYVRGESLETIVAREGPLELERVGRLLGHLCSALEAAHAAGILHRDLTAANMLIVDPGSPEELLKVADFGLARPGGGPYIALEKLTGKRGIGGGTPDYVCPEQIRGEAVDARGDLYSVGVLLFKLLTGRLPFEDASGVNEILQCHLNKAAPSFESAGAAGRVSRAVEGVVQSCLVKFPNERPASARELAERFGQAMGGKIVVESVPPLASPPALPSRLRFDPHHLVDSVEAWMPESIAVVKLKGFVAALGGQVVDSEPGLVRVRLPAPGQVNEAPASGFLGWLGLGRKAVPPAQATLELHMEKKTGPTSKLLIYVVLPPLAEDHVVNPREWQAWTDRIVRELRGYLMSG
jgi:serine/threonine-protein kinase